MAKSVGNGREWSIRRRPSAIGADRDLRELRHEGLDMAQMSRSGARGERFFAHGHAAEEDSVRPR